MVVTAGDLLELDQGGSLGLRVGGTHDNLVEVGYEMFTTPSGRVDPETTITLRLQKEEERGNLWERGADVRCDEGME